MAKKRTGLQSDISSIFSGVPVPKKDSPPPKPEAPPAKPDAPSPTEPPAKAADVEPQQPVPPPTPPAKPADREQPKPVTPPAPPARSDDIEPPKLVPPAAPKPASVPKPAPVPKPKVAEPPTVVPPVKVPVAPAAPKVVQAKVPEPKIQQIPTRGPRRRKDRFTSTKPGVSSGRQKASIVMVVILSIALVVLLGRPYLNSRSNPVIADTAIQTNVGTTSGPNIEIDWPDPPPYQSFYRDPMDPESNGSAILTTTQGIVVTGIVYSEDNPRAIIDRQYYGVGDNIKGATILEITRNSVTFERDGKTWTQRVQEPEL